MHWVTGSSCAMSEFVYLSFQPYSSALWNDTVALFLCSKMKWHIFFFSISKKDTLWFDIHGQLLHILLHGIEKVGRYLSWKSQKKNWKESWKCATKVARVYWFSILDQLYRKIGRLQKFNLARSWEWIQVSDSNRQEYLHETWHTELFIMLMVTNFALYLKFWPRT